MTGRQRPDDVEGTERQRTQRNLAAAGDRGIDPALAQVAERLAERHGPGRAGIRRRQDRAAHVERDAQVGRRRPAEDGQGQVGRHLADPAFEVPRVLLLRVGDAAERRTQVDPDPLRRRRSIRARRHPGIVECQPPGDEAELAEPIELAGGLGRHPGERVEIVDLGGNLAAERTRVEPVDRRHRRAAGAQSRPKRGNARPDRRDQADPGDPDPSAIAHVR